MFSVVNPADVEADWWRFYRIWIDIEGGQFGGLSAQRWFEMSERLPAYDGVLAARMHQAIEEEKKHNPSAKTLAENPGAEVVEGTAETLRGDPALAGVVEVVEV